MPSAGIEGVRRTKLGCATMRDPLSGRRPDLAGRDFIATAPTMQTETVLDATEMAR